MYLEMINLTKDIEKKMQV